MNTKHSTATREIPSRRPFPVPWYVMPDPCDTYEGYLRYTHMDLATMDPPALRREARRLCWWLDMRDTPQPWAAQRLAAVREELRARRQGGGL